MNATEMLSVLDNAIAAKAKAEQDKMNALFAEVRSNMEAVKALLPELREIAPVAKKLVQMGVGNYEYGIWNKFRTDGVSHRWGFTKDFAYFGTEAGGACGSHSLFININTGKWTYTASNGPQMGDADFARFAVAPYIGVMGNVIEERKYWICNGLGKGKMVSGIKDYIARVNAAVLEIGSSTL